MEIRFDKEKKRTLIIGNGDINLLDVLSGKITQLIFTDGSESNAHFTFDQKKVYEYMFHNFLTDNSYLILDVDYRGSTGYGRDCRTAIYHHMGGKDLDDIVHAAHFLIEKYKINPKSIGVYGSSYGRFLALMAMFTAPHVFKAGTALRPVTDWARYHPGYTINILNLPYKDPEAYKKKLSYLLCSGIERFSFHLSWYSGG